jgi:hypothetical protein
MVQQKENIKKAGNQLHQLSSSLVACIFFSWSWLHQLSSSLVAYIFFSKSLIKMLRQKENTEKARNQLYSCSPVLQLVASFLVAY